MYRKDVDAQLTGTGEFLMNVIKEEVTKAGGEVEIDCTHPAISLDEAVVLNHYTKVYIKDGKVFVHYADELYEFDDPLHLLTIDELVTIIDGL